MALQVLSELLPETGGLCVCFGLPVHSHKAVYNACCLVLDGKILGFVAKQALAGDGIHYEPRWFKPWPEGQRVEWELLGERYPVGDLVFDVGGVRIGFEICEDAWTAERPGGSLSKRAVDVILNPSASHFAFGKHLVRRRLVLEGARAFGVTYVYSNLLGNEAGRVIYDGDAIIATDRGILADTPRFSLREFTMVQAVVDVELTRIHQTWRSSYHPLVSGTKDGTTAHRYEWPLASPSELRGLVDTLETEAPSKYEEFTLAQTLGLFDYLRKSQSKGFVVSLSGGADSACT
jgi:NAD+ synthase (glutamine-hydrolysing)